MDEIRIKAKQDYMEKMSYKDICDKYDISMNTLKSWVSRNKWSNERKNLSKKGAHKDKKGAPKKQIEKLEEVKRDKIQYKKEIEKLEDADLTDKQRLFCLYYVKTFNATQAAIKAGYSKDSAHVEGSRLLRNVKVKTEIMRLKGAMQQDVFIDAMDVLNKYIKIAFADVTDYLTFGRKEIEVVTAFGSLEDEEGNPIMKEVNYVDLKESDQVDGSILSEVSQGKDGVKIKLLDKMKALEKLELYFDLFPDKFRREVEEEKLKISREKLELEKLKVQGEDEEYEDDGFIEALKGKASEVWDDEDTEES